MIDICGRWAYAGTALNPDGSTMYVWDARVSIVAEGGGVRVTLEAERSQSRSISRNAMLCPMDDGRTALLYDYAADPAHEGTASHDFFGMTRFVFEADGRSAEGHYFNYNGRYTFGRMTLTRLQRRGPRHSPGCAGSDPGRTAQHPRS